MNSVDGFLPIDIFNRIIEIKTFHPELIENEAQRRERVSIEKGPLVLAAADHNARMITRFDNNPIRLGCRREYLGRLVRVLVSPLVNGLEATPDVIEDLFALNYLLRSEYGIDLLNGKKLIGTINRGGLKGSVWEMDDLPCNFTVERLLQLNMFGAKFMLRINPDREESKHTLFYCAELVNQAQKNGLHILIEILFITGNSGQDLVLRSDLESLIKSIGVASALGNSSLRKWLEVPLNDNYRTAINASTCPVLVVPEERERDSLAIVKEYTDQVQLSPQVQGILLGRNVMYASDDPAILSHAIAKSWHEGILPKESYSSAVDMFSTSTNMWF